MTGRQILKLKAETLTDAEVDEVLDYLQVMQSMNEQTSTQPEDEALLHLLFKAYNTKVRSQKTGVRSQKY